MVNTSSAIIEKCYNTGTIIGSNSNTGGIAGANYGTISQCYNTGNVKCSVRCFAGIVGLNYKLVSCCYNTGTIEKKTTNAGTYGGGIVGYSVSESDNKTYNPVVKNCYNVASIYSCKTNNVETNGTIIGINGTSSGSTAKIENCYALERSSFDIVGTQNGTSVNSSSKTAEQMKPPVEVEGEEIDESERFINLLNAGLATPVWVEKENDYPILNWQVQN